LFIFNNVTAYFWFNCLGKCAHMAAAILVLCPAPPRRVLIFGMGGGAIPAFVQKQFPSAMLDVVDLEPEVVRLALAHFNLRRGPLLNVTLADGRRWVDALPAAGLPAAARYDLVVQDACAGHPCALVTAEAYAAVAARAMAPGALFVQNLFAASPRAARSAAKLGVPSAIGAGPAARAL
jgi:spermidine synthase